MATYDQNEKIIASNNDFENLRQIINNIISNRTIGLGDSSFSKYNQKNKVNSPITQTQNNIINSNPLINGLYVIQDLLKKEYMKSDGSNAQKAAANRIKNAETYDQYSIIPALTDAFTVVNYWNTNNDTTGLGCNGACVGYCNDTCANTETTQSISSTGDKTFRGCGNCAVECTNKCDDMCWDDCSNNCISFCYTICAEACGSSCTTNCTNTCGGACRGGCGSGCQGACYNSCTNQEGLVQ